MSMNKFDIRYCPEVLENIFRHMSPSSEIILGNFVVLILVLKQRKNRFMFNNNNNNNNNNIISVFKEDNVFSIIASHSVLR